jgi:hypothetical protein
LGTDIPPVQQSDHLVRSQDLNGTRLVRVAAIALASTAALGLVLPTSLDAREQSPTLPGVDQQATSLDDARWAFYNARYESAAALALDQCVAGIEGLAACELRTSALLLQINRAMGDSPDRDAAWKSCGACPPLLAAFDATLTRGRAAARARLREMPLDDETLFLLGKLDLNYVWLQLGTFGHRTGWADYWEARRSLDTVLSRQPGHVRARVARGWIDYIVDTKMRRGTRWLLGGGSRTGGLAAIRNAAAVDADFFVRAEAVFALWDMQIRERDLAGAVITAQLLLIDFPANQDLRRFVEQRRLAEGAGAGTSTR